MRIKKFKLFLEGYGIMDTENANRLDTFYKNWEGKLLILKIMECLKKLDVGEVSTYYNSDVADNILVNEKKFLLWFPYDYANHQQQKNFDIITFYITKDVKDEKLKNFANLLRELFTFYCENGPDKDNYYMISLDDSKKIIDDLDHEIDDSFSGITNKIKNFNI